MLTYHISIPSDFLVKNIITLDGPVDAREFPEDVMFEIVSSHIIFNYRIVSSTLEA